MGSLRKLHREERGVAAVEFALVAGLLITILFAVLEFGLLLDEKLVLNQAAREGARRAAIEGGADPAAFQVIRQQLELGRIPPDRVRVDIEPRQAAFGTLIRVEIRYDRPVMTAVLRGLGWQTVPLRAVMVSRSEWLGGGP